jgi:tRNA threonylcarbamoyladenosine modification (KEOPS) complex  Pcc1 subunit
MLSGAKATVRLKLASEKQLTALVCALTPEIQSPTTQRATIKLEKHGKFLDLAVEAKDTVALRATLNAYLRWINSTMNVIDAVKKS